MQHAADPNAPAFTRKSTNLADARLGATALSCSDDFFASMDRMLNPEPAVFIADKYDDHGKWMDGWESRRKRHEGHDWCIVRLGRPGSIVGVDIDTSHFTGNFPPAGSLEACRVDGGDPNDKTAWTTVLPAVSLSASAHHYFEVGSAGPWTHVRLNMYPDGGIARLRVYGRVHRDWSTAKGALIDLGAMENGGRAIAASDEHYGDPNNLLAPGRAINMGGGWETKRRRVPGNEWAIIELGHRGRLREIIVDTHHNKGNYPDRCAIQAADMTAATDQSIITQSMFWRTLLPEHKLQADTAHKFTGEIVDLGPVTHIRFNIIPDGGVSRLRLLGEPA